MFESNVPYQANIEMNKCAAKRKCTKGIQQKANALFKGMNGTKKIFLKNWIQQTFNTSVD